ncbi:MAG: selenocysteine-specific translation elongation factor [Nannocystaceae bacterium]
MAKAPRSVVLGTAGHIDHGKTTLVRALTGVETDRLAEEKRRGITIELGFAAWPIASGIEASVVDVPGHEGLVRTMVAGAGGIDLLLLVISAEDGVMPQTREHLSICALLGIPAGVVALTKVDRLEGDEEAIELATEDVREALADTPFADAPIVPCSATTGEGLDALRSALRKAIAQLPRRPTDDRPILPIDRVFTIKGHGTVVTGTLLSGHLRPRADSSLELVPVGDGRERRTLRARGLEVRGASHDGARSGTRAAINLAGVATSELHRGDVLTLGERVAPSSVVHALVDHLSHDTGPWEDGAGVELCAGTAHCAGRLDPLAAVDADGGLTPAEVAGDGLAPGARGLVRVRLEPAIPTWYGQRIILRRQHATGDVRGDTIGGGVIIDPEPSAGRRQRPRWIAAAAGLMDPAPTTRARALLTDAGALGLDRRALERRAGILDDGADAALAPLVDSGEATALSADRWVRSAAIERLVAQAIAHVDAFHDASPLLPGLGRATLEAALGGRVAADVAAAAVDLACARGELHHFADQGLLTRPGRGLAEGALPPALATIVALYEDSGIAPPTLKEVEAATGMTSRALLDAISTLQRLGALVRVTNELSLAASSHEVLVAAVREHLRDHGDIDVQALKGLTGLSRKFVVPLLEHFDRVQLTRRDGDRRVAGSRAGL